MFRQEHREPARRTPFRCGCARQGEDPVARRDAAACAGLVDAEFAACCVVGVVLVDDREQIGAVGELMRDRVFAGKAGPDALYQHISALEGMERKAAEVLERAVFRDITALAPTERLRT